MTTNSKRRGFRRVAPGLYLASDGKGDKISHRPWVGWQGKWIAEWTDLLGAKHTRAFGTLALAKSHMNGGR